MKSQLPLLAAVLWAGTVLGPFAIGQTIYKCGNVYGQSPCPDGVVVDANDTRTPAQKAQADAATAQAARSADKLERERVSLEKPQAGKPAKKPSKAGQPRAMAKMARLPRPARKRKKRSRSTSPRRWHPIRKKKRRPPGKRTTNHRWKTLASLPSLDHGQSTSSVNARPRHGRSN